MKPNHLLLILCVLFLTSCGKELPPVWKGLEGTWTSSTIYMRIGADGSFKYKREEPGSKVKINTWISEYRDTGFTVNIVVSSTDFVVNKKPFYNPETKTTQMVVDGRLLTKSVTERSWGAGE